jgi:hypothetical protein
MKISGAKRQCKKTALDSSPFLGAGIFFAAGEGSARKNPNFFKIETSKSRFVNSIFIFFGYDTEKDEVV